MLPQLNSPIRYHCEGVIDDVDETLALTFFRVLQEGIHNALKHSHAASMQVRISSTVESSIWKSLTTAWASTWKR